MSVTEESSERHALVSTIAWSALNTLITVGSRFVAGVIAARLLGPEQTGRLMYLLWITDFTAVVLTLAIPHVVTRFWAELEGQRRPEAAAAVSRWLFRWYVGLGLLGAVVAGILAAQGLVGVQAQIFAGGFGVYYFTLALHNYYVAYLAGRQQFRAAARLSLVSSLALLGGVLLAVPRWGVAGASAAYLASAVPGAVLSLGCFRRLGAAATVDRSIRTRLVSYAAFTWMGAIVSALTWSRGEIFFLARYGGELSVAMFAIGVSLSALATQGPLLLTTGALMPHFAQLAGAGRLDTLRSRYATGTRVLSLMLFPLCLGLSSLLPFLLPFIYGRAFAAAVPAAMALVACSCLAFTVIAADVLYALERAWFIAVAGAVGAAAAILAGVLVIPWAGVGGAVASRIVIQTAIVAACAVYLAKYHGFRFPGRDLIGILLASLASAGCSGAIVWAVGHVAAIFVAIPIAAVIYMILIRALGLITRQDLSLFGEVIRRLPGGVAPVALRLVNALARD